MNLIIQPAAREDLLRQYRYYLIEQETEGIADRFLEAAQETIQQIALHPGIGSPKIFNHPALAGLRSASLRRFPAIRAYYLFSGNTIRVLRVLHGKRDVASILESGPDDD